VLTRSTAKPAISTKRALRPVLGRVPTGRALVASIRCTRAVFVHHELCSRFTLQLRSTASRGQQSCHKGTTIPHARTHALSTTKR
jgi:hypothetical protein